MSQSPPSSTSVSERIDQLAETQTSDGRNLAELSRQTPLLMVFLRHGGCPFCLQTLAEVQAQRSSIAANGVQVVLVHLMSDADAKALFAEHGLEDLPRVSDPEQKLYRAFRLRRGSLTSVAGPGIWWEGFKATILKGHVPRMPKGDVRQLTGAFLVSDSRIIKGFRAMNSAGQPDLQDLSTCPLNPP